MRVAKPPKCSVRGCKGAAVTLGLCHKHYQRQRAHGDPTAPSQRQKLTESQVADIKSRKPKRGLNIELATHFGVSEQLISAIRGGKRRASK